MSFDFTKLKNSIKRPHYHHDSVKYSELKVDYNEWGRIYYSPKGHIFPSITTLLGNTNEDKDNALDLWRERLGEYAATKETERCILRGNEVHKLAEQYTQNKEIDYNNYSKLSVDMFKRIRRRLHRINNIYAQEIPLYSYTLGVAGRVDLIAEYDDVLSIIDYKTSTKEKCESWIEDYFIQAAAYSYMFEEMYGIRIEQIIVLIAVENLIIPQIFIENRKNFRSKLLKRIEKFRYLTNQKL